MKKRIFKQGMALMLAAALALPANVVPAEILDQQTETELPHIVLNQETPDEKATDSDAKEKEEQTETQTETKTEVNATETAEQIIYNTGSFNVHVVSAEDFENDLGDAYFEEDGSYTINIPEENPFFPYEVQFTYDGKTENEWFMNPEDSIEIDGHTFYVSASFDGTAVTQLTMDVAGQEVVVYPKEKEFTDGDGVALMSLLPLEERNLYVDLSGFSPIELTQVKISSVFTGSEQLEDADKVLWKKGSEDYVILPEGKNGCINLSYGNRGSDSQSLEMIVGEYDQLADSNIRYYVTIKVTDPSQWLTSTVKLKNGDGTVADVEVVETNYYDYGSHDAEIYVAGNDKIQNSDFLVSLKLNMDQFKRSTVKKMELTDGSKSDGYEMIEDGDGWYLKWSGNTSEDRDVFINAFDSKGDSVGYYSLNISVEVFYEDEKTDYISRSLYDKDGNYVSYNSNSEDSEDGDNTWRKYIYILNPGYLVNDQYRLVLTYNKADETSKSQVLGAFIGKYKTIDEAKEVGASDIKDSLFNRSKGCEADFSKGVYLSVFTGEKDTKTPRLYGYHIFTKSESVNLSSSTLVSFYSVKNAEGNFVNCKVFAPRYGKYRDDYADYSYITILVDEETDLASLAPVFTTDKGIRLYTDKEEISGESLHDFSRGPVHYTASAENSRNAKNYWLQIVKIKQGESWLYMNSLADENAGTREENGIIYTNREVMLNGIHGYEHSILLANMGTVDLSKLSVEATGPSFDSGDVVLDNYWTLKGTHDLFGFQGFGGKEDMNLAKIKLELGDKWQANGEALEGKLEIKEDGKMIMGITLTGVTGDPSIVTEEIPDAVRYVHYGSMIQNSNKYDFNTVSYTLTKGKLPEGMELKPNGELYGVPLETGEFTFTVRMKNSYRSFRASSREFTLKVVDKTDVNVDGAVDQGYDLKERVPDILLSDNNDYTMTSVGVIEEWDNLTLDGKRLVEGVDFDAKSGSTRLTIRSQTLKANNQVGTHTLSAEFREKGTGTLKRAAQNYRVSTKSSGGSSGGSSSGGHSSSGRATVRADVGNIGADGAWVQDAKGWKCKAADGTWYTNCWKELTYQNEKSWYRFDAQGYLVTGWYQENGTWYYLNPKSDGKLGKMMTGWQYINDIWYYFTENAGDKQGAMFCKRWAEVPYNGTVEWYYFDENGTMKTDWLTQDENKFYLYPIADGTRGRMLTGWQKIGDNWYYFHEESDGNKGVLARRTKIGNYYVNSDGVWAK